jgi:glycosyltransferase involved in cell wall biosynthesis
MRFSLIMGTIGRFDEVRNFLETMTRQTLQDFEIIVVDQNRSEDLVGLCESYRDRLSIKHIRIDRKGLSLARNYGLRAAEGEIIAFPDDDCEYPKDLLANIDKCLGDAGGLDGLTAISRDKCNGEVSCGKFALRGGFLRPSNVWRRHISITIFLRKTVCDQIGGFDEQFGVGAKWEGAEESDYLIRALYTNAKVLYNPDIYVYHPNKVRVYDAETITHAYIRGTGFGALAKKHLKKYRTLSQMPEAVSRLLRSAAAYFVFALPDGNRSRYYGAHVRGWIAGFILYSAKGDPSPETARQKAHSDR